MLVGREAESLAMSAELCSADKLWETRLNVKFALHVLISPYIQTCIAVMPVLVLVRNLGLHMDIAWVALSCKWLDIQIFTQLHVQATLSLSRLSHERPEYLWLVLRRPSEDDRSPACSEPAGELRVRLQWTSAPISAADTAGHSAGCALRLVPPTLNLSVELSRAVAISFQR